jgi:hypothetical protein
MAAGDNLPKVVESTMRMSRTSLAAAACFLAANLAQAQTTTGGGIGSGPGIGSGAGIGSGGGGGMGFSGGSGFAGGGGTSGGAAPGTGFTGGAGTTTGRTTTGAGSATTVPTNSNPFLNTYSNPQAIGLSGAKTVFSYSPTPPASKNFGQPLYTATPTPGGATGLGAGLGTGLGGGLGGTDSIGSFTTLGIRRAPAYITTLADDMPRPNHDYAKMKVDLQIALDNSPHLKQKKIDVTVAGSTVILKGRVASARDRRLAEAMVRLTPGVRDVQNELTVAPDPKK